MAPFIMNPFRFGGGVGGAWKELDRVTLGSEQDLISVTGLPNNQYYMLLYVLPKVSAANTRWTFNATTGSEYSSRSSNNGGSDNTFINGVNFYTHAITGGFNYGVGYISNLSSQEKLCSFNETGSASTGAGTASDRAETVSKWADSSNSISSIQLKNTDTGGFDSGSELVVLGWDSTNTTTDNFWQELTSVDWSSGNSITTSTFTPKKYIWYQGWWKTGASMSGAYSALQVGNSTIDTGSNYSERYSVNGSADSTETSVSNMYGLVGQGNSASNVINFTNGFIVNNASNEKLFIADSTFGLDGASNVNGRSEAVGKWANTSNQIDIIKLLTPAGSGNWIAGQVKVWGHD